MYNNVILFGSRGHLARTKIIPALEKKNISYERLSRQKVSDLSQYKNQKNIAYMSIPTQHLFDCIKPYSEFIKYNKPLFVIEKPHGINKANFENLKNFFDSNNLDVVYNDHYIGKQSIINLETINLPNFDQISSIDITLHESQCVNDRLGYFDSVGIVLDMYQSHVLVIISTLLSVIEGKSRLDILYYISNCAPLFTKFEKYDTYLGKSNTKCKISFEYKGITINVSCGKKLTDEKSICIYCNNDCYICIDLSNSKINPYEHIFNFLMQDEKHKFLSTVEIECLWKHINLFNHT